MKQSFKQWVYHATKAPKVINSEEFEVMEAQGWADSPAKFAKIADFGIDESNAEMVQTLGEAMEGVKDAANGALNIDKMDGKTLEEYARTNFNVELDRSRSVKALRIQVKKLVGA